MLLGSGMASPVMKLAKAVSTLPPEKICASEMFSKREFVSIVPAEVMEGVEIVSVNVPLASVPWTVRGARALPSPSTASSTVLSAKLELSVLVMVMKFVPICPRIKALAELPIMPVF